MKSPALAVNTAHTNGNSILFIILISYAIYSLDINGGDTSPLKGFD
ncbi:hypothetical protein CPS_3034 [Colwellia psychrerythraea 34H]|uniref:Uncharacterized protein n=1 Tax=Colwellia psychrerythraea (strain 34H / ATCC BAA-681) TaxID=167879 RepID=Q47ZN7_COLP3|nr:hypothetical protein CPS_3034 [Colwellia psychrerythraea 34H]